VVGISCHLPQRHIAMGFAYSLDTRVDHACQSAGEQKEEASSSKNLFNSGTSQKMHTPLFHLLQVIKATWTKPAPPLTPPPTTHHVHQSCSAVQSLRPELRRRRHHGCFHEVGCTALYSCVDRCAAHCGRILRS
jgi:hypothetical protein